MQKTKTSASPEFLEWAYQSQAPLRTLWRWGDCSYRRLTAIIALFVLKHAPIWLTPIVFALLLDKVATPDQISNRHVFTMVFVLLFFIAGNIPFHTCFISLLSRTSRQLERRLRQALVTRLQQLSIPYHDETESGRLQAKVLRDVEQVHMVFHHVGEWSLGFITSILFTVGYTLYRRPFMLLIYICLAPLVIGLSRAFRNHIKLANRNFRQKIESMNSEVSQMIDMIPVSRAHGIEKTATLQVDQQLEEVRDQGTRLDRINALFLSSAWVVFQLGNLMIFGICCWLYYLEKIQLGEVILFEQLFKQVLMNMNSAMGIYPQIAKGLESVRSIGEVLECPDLEHNQGKSPVKAVTGTIRYENVSYTYRNTELPAVSDVNLEIAPGECVAVVGPSGGGKSTLMRLTIGFRRPTGGRILLDGQDMEEIDMRSWRRFISVVPQESVLFEGSVRENILFGLDQIDESHFQTILEAANVREFVDKLPQGLDTRIGESGARLSGGQRQRLAIARALVRDPRVIVLDEPTSALDVVSEKLVQEAIDRMIKDRTTLIVAHRLSTIRNADRVVVLENGRIVESGAYDELANRPDSAFKRMKDLQG